ncbi:Ubiquinol cytochrome reductase, transmembrane domain,Rieske [2Fe-2S] iron-sulphur domain,Ubiquinol- [Cinara cedri]|uniref:Cytochrome b-c1 complex subunit Rieske, mitochondrial n=1 Tax=Cinara cedri TaxID=506608 RepID=A0A5E4NF58_9HEMI|nr:Ubiquinol cytochrome reductase, transmembrane domain,Rieske [2Fe-2S] iron-sulphur domain,Ubiquinol- [Cinara cedri]
MVLHNFFCISNKIAVILRTEKLHKMANVAFQSNLYNTNNVIKTQVRLAYNDFKFPNYNNDRRSSGKNPTIPNRDTYEKRNAFTYVVLGTAATGSLFCAKAIVHKFVLSMAPAADVLAMASIEVNLSEIPEGKNATIKWRGKPLFVRHRTAAEIETEQNTSLIELRDPEDDSVRVQKPEWLVIIGVCTHLGCVPISNAGDWGGYYCPCHGSHYDAAGRIRKGPAPTNMEIPPYIFLDENTLLVG